MATITTGALYRTGITLDITPPYTGTPVVSSTETYTWMDAFSYGGTNYPAMTQEQVMNAEQTDLLPRVNAFLAYLKTLFPDSSHEWNISNNWWELQTATSGGMCATGNTPSNVTAFTITPERGTVGIVVPGMVLKATVTGVTPAGTTNRVLTFISAVRTDTSTSVDWFGIGYGQDAQGRQTIIIRSKSGFSSGDITVRFTFRMGTSVTSSFTIRFNIP